MNYSLTIVACLFCSFVFSQNTPQLIVNATGHTGKVRGLNFISENELVSISEDKSIRWWDVRSGKELARKYLNSESGADGKLFSMSYNEQNGLIAVGGYTTREISEITIIDAAKKQFNVQLQAFTGPVHALKFSGDGTLLVAGSITGELAVWEINPLNEFKLRSKINIGYQISDIDISPDNASVVVAGNSEVIQCFNTTDLNSSYTFARHFLPANTVSYTQDGEYVISGGQDLFVLLFESTGKFIKKIGKLNHEITDLSISDDSRVLTVLSKNTGEALSYSIPEGDLLTTFQDHNNTAYSSDFHPNSGAGNYTIASSGGHGNELLLGNAVNGALINTLEGGNGAIQQLSIDKTGNLLIATEADENQFQFNFNFKDFVVTNTTEIRSESVSKYRKQPTPYIYKMGKNTIANDAWRDGRILSSKELSKDSILIGSDYSLRLYEGNTAIKEFIGHQGGV